MHDIIISVDKIFAATIFLNELMNGTNMHVLIQSSLPAAIYIA